MYRRISVILSSAVLVLLSVAIIVAQSNCSALLEDALSAVDDNCGGAGRNQACYGYDQVEASFLTEIDSSTFSQPQDLAPVADLASIRTAPLNQSTGTWGVAVMNIQANLPNTLPGQSVTFILMGDVEVENAVAPEDAFQPNDGIEVLVETPAGANIRSGPGLNFNVIGGVGQDDSVLADGLSEDGEWLRVAYRDRPAWLNRVTLADNPDIDDLPVLSDELQTPMQAFYLRTGIGQPQCEEAPDDLLLVQGPDNIEIAITVNGADITLGSSGALRVIEIDGELYLEIIVFDGHFSTDGQTIQAGQRSIMCLGNEESRGLDGESNDLIVSCGASVPENIPPDEFGETWCIMEDLPPDILNYGLEVLCPGEVIPTQAPPPSEGDTSNTTSPSEVNGVDCSSFGITNQSIVATDFILLWTPAQGATEYHVAVFDSAGNQLQVIPGITGTSLGMNGGNGFAVSGSVHVRAFRDGEYACYSSLSYANRVPDPNEPPGGYYNFGSRLVECRIYGGEGYSVIVQWSNADDPVTIEGGDNSYTSTASDGTYELDTYGPPNPVRVYSGDEINTHNCSTYVDY